MHELRDLLESVRLPVGAIEDGKASVSGATGAVLDRSSIAMRELMDGLLAEAVVEGSDGDGEASA